MPEYSIFISKTAQKQLDSRPANRGNLSLSLKPEAARVQKVKRAEWIPHSKRNLQNNLCDVYDTILTVEVIAQGHRKDIYD
jgi:mRNA-degrading endonuclease RelE of RelBE toxin-antitoxin system